MGFRNSALLTLTAALVSTAPASGQEAPPARDTRFLIGQWRGDVVENYHGEVTSYRMFVSIDADRNGRPVASISYSLECRGVWINGQPRGRTWHFEETITAGRDNCAWQAEVELTYNWPPESGEAEHYSGGRNFGHLAYRVDNIYETCQRLADAGIPINRPPRDGNMAFVRSPDKHSVELLQKGKPLPPQEPWTSMPNTGKW